MMSSKVPHTEDDISGCAGNIFHAQRITLSIYICIFHTCIHVSYVCLGVFTVYVYCACGQSWKGHSTASHIACLLITRNDAEWNIIFNTVLFAFLLSLPLYFCLVLFATQGGKYKTKNIIHFSF